MLSTSETPAAVPARLQRSTGAVRVSFKRDGGGTVLDRLFQQGCYKALEAILINTSGGLTDGDRLSCIASWQANTKALITTQAAERIYRSRGGAANVDSRLQIDERASACWLPQETLLFDRGRLDRTTPRDRACSPRTVSYSAAPAWANRRRPAGFATGGESAWRENSCLPTVSSSTTTGSAGWTITWRARRSPAERARWRRSSTSATTAQRFWTAFDRRWPGVMSSAGRRISGR